MKRVSTTRTQPVTPMERLTPIIAQQTEYLGAQQQRAERARIAAAATRGWLYQRSSGGPPCTCDISGAALGALNPDGYLHPEVMDEIVTMPGQSAPDRGLEVFVADDAQAPSVIPDPTTGTHTVQVGEDPTVTLPGFEDIRCPVCFNSGFEPGFRLANGYRAVLTPRLHSGMDFQIETEDRPNTARDGTWVEFDVLIPTRPLTYRVWNTDAVPSPITPTQSPTPGTRGTLRFDLNTDWIMFEVVSVDAAIPIDLTAGHYQDQTDTEYAEVDFDVPGEYRVTIQSVILEDRTGHAWQVRTVTPNRDNRGQVITQQVNARRVRGNELTALLLAAGSASTNTRQDP